jgi:hypothetical protein
MKNAFLIQKCLVSTLAAACFVGALTWLVMAIAGCATVSPGSDPVVVHAEQVETTATSAFQLVVDVDNSDRGYWLTNAPAFHNFAEWLRFPVSIPGYTNEPRGLGMILLVDQAKTAYETNNAMTNVLNTALADLQLALNQASAWATITQPPTN